MNNQQMHINGLMPGDQNIAYAQNYPAAMFDGMRSNPNDLVPVPSEHEVRLWLKTDALEKRVIQLETQLRHLMPDKSDDI